MKKKDSIDTLINIVVVVITIVGFVLILMCPTPKETNTYCRDMVVVEANGADLVLQDINGEVWKTSVSGYQLVDTVIVTLDDNGTSHTIYDDIITEVKPLVVGSY